MFRNKSNGGVFVLSALFLLFAFAHQIKAIETYTVNTNSDGNNCDSVLTFREAIEFVRGSFTRSLTNAERNQIQGLTFVPAPPCSGAVGNYWQLAPPPNGSGIDQIQFSDMVSVIQLTSALPPIKFIDKINGLKPNGSKVTLDGTNAGFSHGIKNTESFSGAEIRNLEIRNFVGSGIAGLFKNSIFEGLVIHNNGESGIYLYPIDGSPFPADNENPRNNRIGGVNPEQRNLIYSNGIRGIIIQASANFDRSGAQGNIIENNYVGTQNGVTDNGNANEGIYLENAFGNVIGGDTTASRNIVSGNDTDGIKLTGGGCHGNRVINNFVGTNDSSGVPLGNSASGIVLINGAGNYPTGGSPNRIGEVGKSNVISGNAGWGIFISGSSTNKNIVQANYIGTNTGANTDVGNGLDGIYIENNASDNLIGGILSGEPNTIFYNRNGVYVVSGTRNPIRQNRIYNNDQLGIDLGPAGVTVNDLNDIDSGANSLQNYPNLSTAVQNGGTVTVSGNFNSTPNASYLVEYFEVASCDASGYGEGRNFIGAANLSTNASGNATFLNSFTFASAVGRFITASATDQTGNTSEFSQCRQVAGCSYSISSSNTNLPANSAGNGFTLTTLPGCGWTATTGAAWITIVNGTGNDTGFASFTVSANTGPARSGTITVAGLTHTVNQASGCTYSLTPNTSPTFGASGGAGNFLLNTVAGCTWFVTNPPSWVTLTGSTSGAGNGTVSYTVAANTGPARSGTITVAGQTFTVNQASGCTYQLSHFSASYPASGTTSDGVSLNAGSGCTWTATSNALWITIISGSSGSGNGTVLWSVAANFGPARTGTVTIAGLTFTINQAAGAPRRAPFDFDGDGKTDIGIFRPTPAEWWINRSSTGVTFAAQFGATTDRITPADFTGDGKTDIAFWRPSNGNWFILRSEDFSFFAFPFGANGDIPAPADFDGDGKADAAVFRPANSTWYISRSTGGTTIAQFGASGDQPVAADYDGDGKADIAIFRPNGANGAEWWYSKSSNNQTAALQFGASTDKAVPGDYTGDGKADIAFWRPSNGNWFILRSEDFSFFAFPFGTNGDIPAPGDYDGDGKFDAAVFRPAGSTWFANRSTAGVLIQQFGAAGDVPVPSAFVR